MLQHERIKKCLNLLSQIWDEMQMGYIDEDSGLHQDIVYCESMINRINWKMNAIMGRDWRDTEYEYREPYPNRYRITEDCGTKMLECPKCKCRIQAVNFSYAVGNHGYKFCPYCGEDVRAVVDPVVVPSAVLKKIRENYGPGKEGL